MLIKGLLITVITFAYRILNLLLWAYCILSWVAMANPRLYDIYMKLDNFMRPIMAPFRKICAPLTYRIGIDFSPLILVLAFDFVIRFVMTLVTML